MYVADLYKNFYSEVIKTRILIIVAADVDALAACRILQQLFHSDNALYTLVPVTQKSEVVKAYREHGDGISNVLLLNCGATWDVVEDCKPRDDNVVFYIADSHRPVHIHNVYNTSQVRLLMQANEDEGIPAFEELFREDDDADDLHLDELSIEDEIDKRRERRQWEEQRKKRLFDYTQFSYYGPATAVTMFEISWKMSRDTNDILWWAILGLSEQHITGKIDHNRYILEAGSLQAHVTRRNNASGALPSTSIAAINTVQISFDQELCLPLYSHWSLLESLQNSPSVMSAFKLWTQSGQRKLQEFLAELGLPLQQCKQQYASMDMNLRSHVKEWMCDAADKYGLDQLLFACFSGRCGYRDQFFASDAAYGLLALVESPGEQLWENFFQALDALSWSHTDTLRRGIQQAKGRLLAVAQQVHSFMNLGSIICAGPFLYGTLPDGSAHQRLFGCPSGLIQLAQCALRAHAASTRSRRLATLPLVLAAEYAADATYTLVVGVPPLSQGSPKNFFGQAFQQASSMTHCTFLDDFFHSPAVLVYAQDKGKFFDALMSLLV
ncbi:cell division control protein 45 homolog [Ixodes scapularis]|uniref:cell division control protein 45 homolog n=1 Tax=Ixodes scapularis TaxID=6945 RepID=UPI001125371F|nr:cell division control protein 45 homolog [Ixodes scapularis]